MAEIFVLNVQKFKRNEEEKRNLNSNSKNINNMGYMCERLFLLFNEILNISFDCTNSKLHKIIRSVYGIGYNFFWFTKPHLLLSTSFNNDSWFQIGNCPHQEVSLLFIKITCNARVSTVSTRNARSTYCSLNGF